MAKTNIKRYVVSFDYRSNTLEYAKTLADKLFHEFSDATISVYDYLDGVNLYRPSDK